MMSTGRFSQQLLASASFLIVLLCTLVEQARAQMTSNVLERVRMIRPAGSAAFGTGFTIEVDGRQYLITAKHVVARLKSEGVVEIRKGKGENEWQSVPVKVFRCQDPIDIAVLVPPSQLTQAFPMEPTMGGLYIAQDVYFLGFPYGLFTIMNGFPVPLVKKAILSGQEDEKGATLIYLDGYNNKGFSGGPIVYRDLEQPSLVYKLAGVVSGYRAEGIPVYSQQKIKPEDVKPLDREEGRIVNKGHETYRVNDTDEFVWDNTGIVRGYAIRHAVDLIKKHPIGPKIAESSTGMKEKPVGQDASGAKSK